MLIKEGGLNRESPHFRRLGSHFIVNTSFVEVSLFNCILIILLTISLTISLTILLTVNHYYGLLFNNDDT